MCFSASASTGLSELFLLWWFLPYFVLVHPTPSLIFEVLLVPLESFCILQGVGELKVGDGLVGWD